MSPPIELEDGRYVLRELLGAGNFGEVWRGEDRHQAVEVAVKLLEDPITLDEVLMESRLLARLRDHEHVVTIRNVVIAAPRPFIVMDFMAGGSVGARLSAGTVTLVEAVRWVRHALAGLGHAHSLGVLHRDVKPGNMLLDERDRAVLSDFGIAEDTIQNILLNDLIYTRHAAPELGTTGSSVQTDIWAMGCTLYRLLTGEHAFEGPDDARARPLTDPHQLNIQIPLSVTRVVRSALAVDPAERFASATEMIAALNACGVVNSWSFQGGQDDEEQWTAQVDAGTYSASMSRRARGGFEVVVKLDRGRGARRVFRRRNDRVPGARQLLRKALVAVVEGRSP